MGHVTDSCKGFHSHVLSGQCAQVPVSLAVPYVPLTFPLFSYGVVCDTGVFLRAPGRGTSVPLARFAGGGVPSSVRSSGPQ